MITWTYETENRRRCVWKVKVEEEMVKKKKLWNRKWSRMPGTFVLVGGLLVTEASVAYASTGNEQARNVQADKSVKTKKLSIEEYLKQSLEEKQQFIDVRAYNMTQNELEAALEKIYHEDPSLYWVFDRHNYIKNDATGKVETYVQWYLLDRNGELDAEWKIVEEMTKDCKTDLEKAIVVYDYLCDTITYEFAGVDAHNIEGAILNKKAVCEGYAMAY